MTDEERREIKEYIDEAVQKAVNAIRKDDAKYAHVSDRLFRYYKEGMMDAEVTMALIEVSSSAYFDIIPLYFRDKLTIEAIAEEMGINTSTVVRNKKKICLRMEI